MLPNALYVKDFYRRWWWAYLLAFILFAIISAALCFDKNRTPMPFGVGVFVGVLLLASELNFRTNARTLMTLPISLKSLCASLWFITIPYSALFVTAAAVTGVNAAKLLGASNVPGADALLRLLLLTMSMNAIMFVVLTFLLHRQPENMAEQFVAGISGGAWGLGISCGISVPMLLNRTPEVMEKVSFSIMVAGVICAIISWHRCPIMLQSRTRRGEKTTQPLKATADIPTNGSTGFRYMLQRNFKMALSFSLFMQVVMLLIIRLMHAPKNFTFTSTMVIFPLIFISLILHLPYLSLLRFLRSLPISGPRLARLFIYISLVTSAGSLLPITLYPLLGLDISMLRQSLPLLIAGIGCFCLLNSFLLHAGAKWAFFIPIVMMPGLVLIPIMMPKAIATSDITGNPLLILLGIALLWAAYLWNLRNVTKRSRIYQPNFHMLAKAQMGI